jgi:hypothetical protein
VTSRGLGVYLPAMLATIVALLVISVAVSTREHRAEAKARLAPYEPWFAGAAVILWLWILSAFVME